MSDFVETHRLRRFMSYIVMVGPGCWNWTGAKNGNNYGGFLGQDGVSTTAHRVSYEWFVGPIPEDAQVDHICRNRLCVNPLHLEAVTARENTQRAILARGPYCRQGHLMTDETSRVWSVGKGKTGRYCLVCKAQRRQMQKDLDASCQTA